MDKRVLSAVIDLCDNGLVFSQSMEDLDGKKTIKEVVKSMETANYLGSKVCDLIKEYAMLNPNGTVRLTITAEPYNEDEEL